jgi:hypothetical protein
LHTFRFGSREWQPSWTNYRGDRKSPRRRSSRLGELFQRIRLIERSEQQTMVPPPPTKTHKSEIVNWPVPSEVLFGRSHAPWRNSEELTVFQCMACMRRPLTHTGICEHTWNAPCFGRQLLERRNSFLSFHYSQKCSQRHIG